MAYAERAAKVIFSRYPTTEKAAPEFLFEFINCLSEQPKWLVDRVADRYLGISAKYQTFLPTVGQLVDMIGSFHEMRERAKHYEGLAERKRLSAILLTQPTRAKYIPFPKLWGVFADDAPTMDKLNTGLSFDMLFDASKALATKGRDAAFAILWRGDIYPQPVDTRATSRRAA